jgi:hypothetical protein
LIPKRYVRYKIGPREGGWAERAPAATCFFMVFFIYYVVQYRSHLKGGGMASHSLGPVIFLALG